MEPQLLLLQHSVEIAANKSLGDGPPVDIISLVAIVEFRSHQITTIDVVSAPVLSRRCLEWLKWAQS